MLYYIYRIVDMIERGTIELQKKLAASDSGLRDRRTYRTKFRDRRRAVKPTRGRFFSRGIFQIFSKSIFLGIGRI